MNATFELQGAWGVDPFEGRSGPLDLIVNDGVITRAAWLEGGGADEERDRTGRLLVAPAFIDLDAALDAGPDDGEGEIAATLAEAAAHGGYASVSIRGWTDVSPIEGLPARLRAAPDRLPSAPPVGALLVSLLRAAAEHRSLTVAAEDTALSAGTEAGDGLAATILGLRPAPAEAEVAAVRRALEALTEAVRLERPGVAPRLHLSRISLGDSVGLVRRAKAAGLPVTADATAHHLALHEGWLGGDRRLAWEALDAPWRGPVGADAYQPSTRARPPLRAPADALAVARGVDDGTIDAIVSAHEPFRSWQTEVEFGDAPAGMSGIETVASLLMAAVHAQVVSLRGAIRALTAGPSAVLGEEHRGLVEGRRAYLTVIDPEATWQPTEETLRSRARNTPLLGCSLPSTVLWTIMGGRTTYQHQRAPERLALVAPRG